MDQICNSSGLEEACKSSWMDGETIDLHKINMYESNAYMRFISESLKIRYYWQFEWYCSKILLFSMKIWLTSTLVYILENCPEKWVNM